MTHRIPHISRNAIRYLVWRSSSSSGVGGGYAYAASKTKTITVCADKGTGVLHLKNRGRCKRGQTRVTWNQQGPQGVQGPAGQTGRAGRKHLGAGDQCGVAAIRAGSIGAASFGRHVSGDDYGSGVRPRQRMRR